jgi:hypothetical protein
MLADMAYFNGLLQHLFAGAEEIHKYLYQDLNQHTHELLSYRIPHIYIYFYTYLKISRLSEDVIGIFWVMTVQLDSCIRFLDYQIY